MMSKYALVSLPLAAVTLLGAGCASATPSVGVTHNGQVTTYTDPTTGTTVNLGAGATIPSDFPEEVPVYANATVQTAAVSMASGNPGATLLVTTVDSGETVTAWYADALLTKGWIKTGTYNYAAQSSTIFTKETATISLTISPSDEAGKNSVFVIWSDDVGAKVGP